MRITVSVSLFAILIASGCSNLERSRSLTNPETSARTIALQVCSNCHGVDGNSTSPNFPNLAAQQKTYFVAQLKEFRGHNRLDPAGFEYMWGLSRSLTDSQIDGLADYFAVQIPKRPALPDVNLARDGRDVYEKGVPGKNIPSCSTCHGDRGQGNDTFPRLAYQHSDYVYKQLIVFQRTDERPEGRIMETIAHDLTEQNMKAVAAYLQGFPAP